MTDVLNDSSDEISELAPLVPAAIDVLRNSKVQREICQIFGAEGGSKPADIIAARIFNIIGSDHKTSTVSPSCKALVNRGLLIEEEENTDKPYYRISQLGKLALDAGDMKLSS